MKFLIELLVELLIEGSIEISQDKRVTKFIRYPIIIFIVVFFLLIILGLIIIGIYILKDNIYIGLFFIVIGLILLFASVKKFTKKYIQRKDIIDD